MKRTLFCILLTLILVSTLFLSNTFAQYQDYMQLSLPERAKARFGKGWISGDIVYSSDGTRLAVASSIGIWIYNANTFAEVALFTGHTKVNSVAFSPDGKTLASGSDDHTVRLWDVRTGELLHTLEEHTYLVLSVAFSPDGKTLASSDGGNTIRLWDTHTFQLLHTLSTRGSHFFPGQSGWVYSVAFSPDGKTLASGSRNESIRLWDVSTGKRLVSTGGHEWGVKSVALSSDGVTLASGDGDGYVRLWGARTGKHWQTLGRHQIGAYTGVNSVAFSPGGEILASGGNDNKIKLWDAVTGEHLRTLEGHTSSVLGVSFSPNGHTIASASWTAVRFWDANTGRLSHTLGPTRSLYSVALSPDGRTIAAGHGDGTVQLSDATTGQHKQTLTKHEGSVYSMAFSPDGKTLVSGSSYGTSYLWDIASGERLQKLIGHRDRHNIFSVSFSPNGTTLASGSSDQTIRLWDVETGENKQTIKDHAPVRSVSFSPNGQMLVSASVGTLNERGGIRLWHLRTGRRLKTLVSNRDYDSHYSVAFSPDGSLIAGGVVGEVWFWDPRSGERLQKLIGHRDRHNIFSVSFSPNGTTLASGSSDQTIRLWDVETGENKHTFKGHADSVISVSFSPDGRTLASGSLDGTVLLWELTSSATPQVTPSTPTTSKAIVSLSPSPVQSPAIGQQLTLSLKITDGENVAGYQAKVHFDTAALKYVESTNRDYLPSGAFFVPPTVEGNTVTLASTSLAGESNGDGALATITFEIIAAKASTVRLSDVLLTDSTGGSSSPQTEDAEITEPEQLPEDVNKDGVINIIDLTLVASNFGKSGQNVGDVNGDGIVNIIDLTLVAAAFGNTAAAPSAWSRDLEGTPTRAEVEAWLREARQVNLTAPTFQRGILILAQLLATLTPKEPTLLPNYPNPFNPETWIPYELAKASDVRITIYDASGTVVRRLELGHKRAGYYTGRGRAAHWDGRNAYGEKVANGVYLYQLKADKVSPLRKMVILK